MSGGFIEAQGVTPRLKLTSGQIAAAVPSSRGVFTFPAPYNTRAWRVTDASDCSGSGDCIWYAGYSYWRNMNYHVNDDVIKIFLGSNTSSGGVGPLLFELNKSTEVLTKIGPIFSVGSSWRNWPGEGWYWNHRNQDWLYISDQTHWYRYNVVNQTQQLMIDAVGMWGSNREVVQMHSNWNDTKHVFTVRVGTTNAILGAGYYNESTGFIRFYNEPTMNEAMLDQSGRYTLLLMQDGSNKFYDNETGTLLLNEPEGTRALGHADAGWEFFVGPANNQPAPVTVRTVLWTMNPVTFQGQQHASISFNDQLNHVSMPGSTFKGYQQQAVYGSTVDDSIYENEMTVVRMGGATDHVIVAPLMSRLSAAGGGIDYAKYPKGNVDVTGEYFLWTTNLGGSRIDAFIVKVPLDLVFPQRSELMPTELATLTSKPLTYWGGRPDGSTDNAAILREAVDDMSAAGGGEITFPRTALGNLYRFSAGILPGHLGNNITFRGVGGVTLSKEFDGDFFPCVSGGGTLCKWKDLIFDLYGDQRTGALIRFGTNSNSQEVTGCVCYNGADSILLYEDIGGVLSHIHHNQFTLHASRVATGAVVKRDTNVRDTQAGSPRMFDHNFTGAFTWFAIVDGFSGAYFDQIYSAGISLGDNSLGNEVNNCRLAVPAGMTAHISGNSTIMQGCQIGGDLTVDPGFLYGKFHKNLMDPTKVFTDNSIKTNAAGTPYVEDPRLALGQQIIVMTTGNLPSPSAAMNNRVVIVDNGASAASLAIYKGGKRFIAPFTEG